MRFIIVQLVLLGYFALGLSAQVTANVLQRVFKIATAEFQGSAFTIDVDGQQYLVTAAHLLPKKGDTLTIKIFHDEEWQTLDVRILRCPEDIDIAVLVPPKQISVTLPLEPTSQSLKVGGQVYFLGFPYGMSMSFSMASGHPLSLVKRGTVSGFFGRPRMSGFLLDGLNIAGFSGGPIVFQADPSVYEFRVAGVVGGYVSEDLPVWEKNAPTPNPGATKKPDNSPKSNSKPPTGSPTKTKFFVKANTGIAYGFDIRYAVDAIKQNSKVIGSK